MVSSNTVRDSYKVLPYMEFQARACENYYMDMPLKPHQEYLCAAASHKKVHTKILFFPFLIEIWGFLSC